MDESFPGKCMEKVARVGYQGILGKNFVAALKHEFDKFFCIVEI